MYIKRIQSASRKGRTPRRHAQMELHNLHQQHRSSSQGPNTVQSSHGVTNAASSAPDIRAAVTPEQWAKLQKENDTLDKLVHKLAYQVEELEEDRKHMKARADKYKQQLKEHVGAQEAFIAKHDKVKAQLKGLTAERDRLQAKVDEHKLGTRKSGDSLADCKAKLEATTAELKKLKAEIPEVQKLLVQGGEATKRLQAMETKDSKKIQELQHQLEASRVKAKASDEKLRAMSSASGQDHAGLKAKNQQLQSEVASMRERLKAASTQASTSISQVQACKDMLARAEGVLRTCTELHESKGDALGSALQETIANLSVFLKSLKHNHDNGQ